MKYILQILYIALLARTIFAVVVNPFPAPRNITWGNSGQFVIGDLTLQLNQDNTLTNNDYIVHQAFDRFWSTVSAMKWYPAAIEKPMPTYATKPYKRDSSTVNTVNINVGNFSEELQLGVNETYTLNLKSGDDSIYINAATTWGALHALTTLQQLIIYENDQFIIEQPVSIWDSPLYKHRGIMIDSGRNFISVIKIFEQIDAMGLSKMNSLHWHLADSQSWPIEMECYPMAKDAYSARETYSQQDLKSIVAYGKNRGVRIIPEIDMPGHANAGWKQADANIVTCGNVFWTKSAAEPVPGQLEILDNNTYTIVENVYNELSSIFIDDMFHVGGDELNAGCYNYSAKVQEYYAEDPTRNLHDLYQIWVDKTQKIFRNSPTRKLTMWEDVVDTSYAKNVPKDIIMQSWNEQANIANLTARGYEVIVSSYDFLYLDCGHGSFLTNDPRSVNVASNDDFNNGNAGSWCGPFKSWQRIYNYDFLQGLSEEQQKLVIGAEATLFSEQADSSDVTQKFWPRVAALAESTWSGNRDDEGFLRTNFVTQRILNFREYLVALNIPATALVPKYCVQNAHACDLNENQYIYDWYSKPNATLDSA